MTAVNMVVQKKAKEMNYLQKIPLLTVVSLKT